MGVLVFLVLVVLCLVCSCIGQRFVPADNYMIDCGSNFNTSVGGGIVYVADDQNSRMLSTPRPIVFANASNTNPISSPLGPGIYRNARLFTGDSTYTLPISRPGRHWIRLHFYPFVFQNYNLSRATFSVTTQQFTLLRDFQQSRGAVVKEFSVNVTGDSLVIRFLPRNGSFAFLNALEVVSVPNDLIADIAINISPRRTFDGLSRQALETVHRVNMGGPLVSPTNDTLGRTWVTDDGFLLNRNLVNPVSNPGAVKYDEGYADENSAPIAVYGTVAEMTRVDVTVARFNMTWEFDVDPDFEYLIRLHFCDIDSDLNQLMFNVYVASQMVSENFDISKETNNRLGTPLFLDYIAKSNQMRKLSVSIGPSSDPVVDPNGILNGLEIMKISNSAGSLDAGPSVLNPAHQKSKMKAGVIAGAIAGACVLIAVGIFICLMCRRRRLQTQNSKTWVPFMTNGGGHSQSMASKFSNGTHATTASNLGYQVPFKELQEATDNFNESLVVGVGGFGKVYKGVFRDGRKVAVKRGNPQSQQGLAEFRTEIELLSQFRHRHLVSLIGYCDERNEMILIYEYMEKGTLKSHLYGSDFPSLDWKQRLEICIGSARGLHYLHTGYAKAIIHRDVKSANILLDENLMAKVADFGLSKTGPDIDQTHVSTAVKGSFGYLDPEYFRRQQLTEKSDVYSFGVVLFEVLCARPVIDPSLPREKVNLGEWAMKFQTSGNLEQIIDPKLAGTVRPDSLRKFGETAEKCLAEYGVDRPSMADVLWNLEYALQLQEAGNQSDPSENSTNQIGDISPLVSNASFVETSAMNEQYSSVDDLSGTSMSKVFSQLIKAEGR